MKAFKLNYTIFLAIALIFSSVTLFAQQEDNKEVEKEIVIIKETIDEDGNKVVKKIIKKGDSEDVLIESIEGDEDIHVIKLEELEGLSDELQEKLKNIQIDIDEDNLDRRIKIIMDKDEEGHEPIIIEWEGHEDIPEDIEKELEKHGVILNGDEHEGHAYGFMTRDKPSNKACLGVMIGKTVENENGHETVEGISDKGVAILDVFEGSGAEEAGLAKDDIIMAINGAGVATIHDVLEQLKPFEGGETVTIEYLRDDQPAQVNATLKTCENKFKIKNVEKHGDKDFNFEEEMNWVFENEEEGKNHHKRTIIIKKKIENGDVIEETITEDDELAPIDDEGNTVNSSDGMSQTLELQEVNLFPNPTAGKLTVEFKGAAEPTTVEVIDVAGKVIYSEEINDFDGVYRNEINLANAPKGTLMLTVKQNDKVYAEKVMVQ